MELEAARAAEARLLEELRELPAGEAALEGVPALLRRRVVRVVAVVEPLAELCGRGEVSERGRRGKGKGDVPGLLRTSYASFTAAIFASLPPLSGWAVRTALRLGEGESSEEERIYARGRCTHYAFLIVFASASRATPSTL